MMDEKQKAIEKLEQGIKDYCEFLKNNKDYQAYKNSMKVEEDEEKN